MVACSPSCYFVVVSIEDVRHAGRLKGAPNPNDCYLPSYSTVASVLKRQLAKREDDTQTLQDAECVKKILSMLINFRVRFASSTTFDDTVGEALIRELNFVLCVPRAKKACTTLFAH